MAERAAPRLFTIPPGARFLDVLAEALVEGRLVPGFRPADDPLLLADATIYLPTRRACRALEAVFVARAPQGATVLPRIAPLGDVDEDDEAFAEEIGPAAALPPPLSPLERQLTLARLVAAWTRGVRASLIADAPEEAPPFAASPADALALAGELGKLIDSVETEEVDWLAFERLVPADYDEAWRVTADFLAIAVAHWPGHLQEIGRCDPAWRRARALRALAQEFRTHPPRGPVIAAGSTGSIPATAALLAAIASLPQGAVVLPGLDSHLDDPSWEMLGAEDAASFTSPQGGLKRLIDALGAGRADVATLGEAPNAARAALISTALRPAQSTELWASAPLAPDAVRAGLDGLTLVEAANEREEALAIAAIVRETLETPGRTVAVITPDRDLARRVTGELARWDIDVEDSAGCPLAGTPVGVFARLIAEAAASSLAPLDLLALIQHARARFGIEEAEARRAAEALEIATLRGPAPPREAEGLLLALDAARADARNPHRRRLSEADWIAAEGLIRAIGTALAPLAVHGEAAPLGALAEAHRAAILAAGAEPENAEAAFDGTDGEALAALLENLAASDGALTLRLADYPAAIATLMGGVVVRPPRPRHARVAMLGLLEARLVGADRLVLAGLDEGTWPPQTRNDPWLSRPMRRTIGLPPPERRIGLGAHDFAQGLAHPAVTVTRALKRGGVPTTPARWLQRLAAVAGADAWTAPLARGADVLALAATLDEAPREAVPPAPQPRPPLPLRPARLSVTEVETLVRDPYAIYAKHVLKLHPLDPPGLSPGAGERGSIVHDVLARFVAEGPDPRNPAARDSLVAMGRAAFAPVSRHAPDVAALWWPRFLRVADWFLGWEAVRRDGIAASFVERDGRLEWPTASGRTFALTGRADRFDALADGRYAVVDYKTGQLPGVEETAVAFSPQLPLEAAMLAAGAFRDVPAGETFALTYVRVSGGTPPGEERTLTAAKDGRDAAAIASGALARLKGLVDAFEDEDKAYTSLDHPKFRRRPNGPYDHLARVREWSLAGDEGGE